MPQCPSCEEPVKANWTHCPACGANVKDRHYSKDDDPLEKLNAKVDAMDEFLTDKFPEEVENAEEDNANERRNRKKAAAKKKRKTIFGD